MCNVTARLAVQYIAISVRTADNAADRTTCPSSETRYLRNIGKGKILYDQIGDHGFLNFSEYAESAVRIVCGICDRRIRGRCFIVINPIGVCNIFKTVPRSVKSALKNADHMKGRQRSPTGRSRLRKINVARQNEYSARAESSVFGSPLYEIFPIYSVFDHIRVIRSTVRKTRVYRFACKIFGRVSRMRCLH